VGVVILSCPRIPQPSCRRDVLVIAGDAYCPHLNRSGPFLPFWFLSCNFLSLARSALTCSGSTRVGNSMWLRWLLRVSIEIYLSGLSVRPVRRGWIAPDSGRVQHSVPLPCMNNDAITQLLRANGATSRT